MGVELTYMKKRFLTTGGRDDYYDIPYVRSHRNLTRDALDSLEDEETSHIDSLPSKVTCRSKHKWDERYVSNAGKRWLHSNVGKVWDKIRQEYIDYTAGKGLDYLVETTTMIDGVLHIVDTFGPRTLDEMWGDIFYVDEHGILQYLPRKSYDRKTPAPVFLIHEKMVWFRRGPTLFYCVPMEKIKVKGPCMYSNYFRSPFYSDAEFPFKKYEGYYRLPTDIRDGHVLKSDIKQAPKKEIPQEAYSLACIDCE